MCSAYRFDRVATSDFQVCVLSCFDFLGPFRLSSLGYVEDRVDAQTKNSMNVLSYLAIHSRFHSGISLAPVIKSARREQAKTIRYNRNLDLVLKKMASLTSRKVVAIVPNFL